MSNHPLWGFRDLTTEEEIAIGGPVSSEWCMTTVYACYRTSIVIPFDGHVNIVQEVPGVEFVKFETDYVVATEWAAEDMERRYITKVERAVRV